ncbi:YebC/PmpR family DNA-binding transcriptional regulator [Ructibacterium gallinarum]|uniref:Probable transcriptional regulatory protein INF28_07260 n=1 Tax=Ructibacterium gallinarum TaxID=2779355 RepID=A0A9D5RBQ2_9FIRM|nr:YebC/PmpR family DNA-binding transcriptional regulator [Ructibacterium gallinarum]MBE5040258.1 YebC/PmpR family DNA-binding transcriptional regulator [Ructibacterium gallinarum]
MSGHSKWATIKRKKGAIDAKRGKIFTKLGRELMVAVKEGGPDPDSNSKLRDVIAKAKANNMPNDTIQRSIKKASGEGSTNEYFEMVYEGYGPSGIAVIVETLTDNKNRTAGDLRHFFDKNGGNLGQNGCVSFMFDRKGVLVVEKGDGIDEDALMMDALEAGADDFNVEDDCYEILTAPESFSAVREALEKSGYSFVQAEINYIPQTTTVLEDPESVKKMEKLIDMLEENDDVQNVYHTWEMPEDSEE